MERERPIRLSAHHEFPRAPHDVLVHLIGLRSDVRQEVCVVADLPQLEQQIHQLSPVGVLSRRGRGHILMMRRRIHGGFSTTITGF